MSNFFSSFNKISPKVTKNDGAEHGWPPEKAVGFCLRCTEELLPVLELLGKFVRKKREIFGDAEIDKIL